MSCRAEIYQRHHTFIPLCWNSSLYHIKKRWGIIIQLKTSPLTVTLLKWHPGYSDSCGNSQSMHLLLKPPCKKGYLCYIQPNFYCEMARALSFYESLVILRVPPLLLSWGYHHYPWGYQKYPWYHHYHWGYMAMGLQYTLIPWCTGYFGSPNPCSPWSL